MRQGREAAPPAWLPRHPGRYGSSCQVYTSALSGWSCSRGSFHADIKGGREAAPLADPPIATYLASPAVHEVAARRSGGFLTLLDLSLACSEAGECLPSEISSTDTRACRLQGMQIISLRRPPMRLPQRKDVLNVHCWKLNKPFLKHRWCAPSANTSLRRPSRGVPTWNDLLSIL